MKLEEQVIEYIKMIFEGESSGHDYWHSLRVYRNAMLIAEEEEVCNVQVVMLASLLHDVDDPKLFHTKDYENARRIMNELGVDSSLIEEVIGAVSTVSFKGTDTVIPQTMEGKIVQDADRLDAIGAIGIARAFAFGGSRGREIYHPGIEPKLQMNEDEYRKSEGTTINHFYEKLFLLEDLMNTKTAKAIASNRTEYMKSFLEEFYSEWNGKA